jgi:hypothetical protein
VRILSLFAFQEDHSELKLLIRNVVIAACLLQLLNWICENLFYLSRLFTAGFSSSISALPSKLNGIFIIHNSIILLVFLLVLFILSTIISIQIAIRTIEIAFLMILGPIVITTIVNKEMNFFSRWWRNMVALVFAQSLQVLLIVIGVEWIFKYKFTDENRTDILLLGVGLFVLIMRVPALLNEWFQSSSAASSVNGFAAGMAKFAITKGFSLRSQSSRNQQQMGSASSTSSPPPPR